MNKLVLVTDAWTPQINGVVTTLQQMCQQLQQQGIQIEVIHPGLFRNLPCPTYPDIRLALDIWRLPKMLQAAQADAYHIATEGPLGLAARRYLNRQQLPFSTSLHTKFPEYVHSRCALIPLAWGYRFLRWFHRPSRHVLVTTLSNADELSAQGLSNLVVWGRGVDTELFRPQPRHPQLAEPMQHCGQPLLLYVGRVAVEKNLEAFLQLPFPARKRVVGDGPARTELEKRYPEVEWVGFKRGQALAQEYAQADVFVFPSRTDTFGLVMLEAMACGTPVAAYPVTGPIDVVQPGVSGFLDEDLARAVQRCLQLDRSLCRRAAEGFSWQACAERFRQHLVPIHANSG